MAPTNMMKLSAASEPSNSGDMRATMKMPAVTMVAAWISAEIGVGPSMESGSHTCSGIWADLPMAPMNRQMQITVSAFHRCPPKISNEAAAMLSTAAKASVYCSDPVK